jgi:hypothetical protein
MIFSPSQTSTFQRCPMAHHLSRTEGWRPKVLAKRDAAAIVGSAFAAGMESWNRHRQSCGATVVETCAEVASALARTHADAAIARLLDAGCVIPSPIRAEFDYASTIAARAVERVCAADPIPADWTVVDVERAFEEHGNARPDLVCRDADGALVIVDYKCAMALKDGYVAERLDTYRRSAQMYHYVWAAREVYGEWDTPRRWPDAFHPADVRRYAIVLVRIEPWKVWFQPYEVDERLLARWTDSAWATWERMATPPLEGPPSHWENCVTKFGPCEYTAACFNHGLDEDTMALDYVRVPRKEEVA